MRLSYPNIQIANGEGMMAKIAVVAALVFLGLVVPAMAAQKASWGECRTKVVASPTYRVGTTSQCYEACQAAIRRCMANGGKVN